MKLKKISAFLFLLPAAQNSGESFSWCKKRKNVLIFIFVCAIIQELARRADHSEEMIGWIRQQAEMPGDLSGFFEFRVYPAEIFVFKIERGFIGGTAAAAAESKKVSGAPGLHVISR